jgi:hypothetical protein
MTLGMNLVAKKIIEVGIKSALSHHTRVLTLESARGSIAGIGKGLFANVFTFLVKTVEGLPGHENLTTNLEGIGIAQARLEHKRNGGNAPYVGGDIVAMSAVATSDSPDEASLLIGKRDGQTVVLHLTTNLEVLALKTALHLIIPLLYVLLVVGVGKREHRIAMGDLTELLSDIATHAHGGRVGIVKLRMTSLKVLKLVHEEIKLLVGYDRAIQNIITVIMLVELLAQLYYSFGFSHN